MNEDDDTPLPESHPWLFTALRALACGLLCWGFLAGVSLLSIGFTNVLAVLTLVSLFVTYELLVRAAPMTWIAGAAFCILGLGAGSYGLWHVTRPPQPVGPLLPANDPTPAGACREKSGPGDITLIAARNRIVMKGPGPWRALTVQDCPMLYLTRAGRGLRVDASFYNWTDDISFRIADNTYEPYEALRLRAFRPDPHTLVVLDRFDQEVFYLRFLNPGAVRLRGRFLCAEQPQMIIRNDTVLSGGVRIGGVYFGQKQHRQAACGSVRAGQPGVVLKGR